MQAEDSPGIIQQILSGSREHGSARLPAEQVTIEARLEPFDLVADGRLRKAQGLGRAGMGLEVVGCYRSDGPDIWFRGDL